MAIDYSRWKDIEISDDEDDTHPNIDTPSLFRWRHKARLERMAEMKEEKEKVEGEKKKVLTRVQEIEEKLSNTNLDEKERIKLELERDQIKKQEEEYLRKEKELADKEKLTPWNVDTIGKEAWSRTIVNKPKDKSQQEKDGSSPGVSGAFKPSEEEEHHRLLDYFSANETLLGEMSLLEGFDEMEKMLLEHPHLACEHATNWLTIEALNHAIDEDDDKMGRVAENCITIQYLIELAKSLRALSTNTNLIKSFFKKIRSAEAMYMQMYVDEVQSFKQRLRKRAKDKRDAYIEETEKKDKDKRIEASPGGLDPIEVLYSLPEPLRDAFESQSMEKIFQVAETMDREVFNYHLQRCIDSGLWIPNAKEHEEKLAKEKEKEANEKEAEGKVEEEVNKK